MARRFCLCRMNTMNVQEYYHNALSQRGYKPDEAQLRAITVCSNAMTSGWSTRASAPAPSSA
jgi:hypothetical protein